MKRDEAIGNITGKSIDSFNLFALEYSDSHMSKQSTEGNVELNACEKLNYF